MEDKLGIIGPLAHWLAAGKLESRVVLASIEKLAGQGQAVQPKSLLALLEALEGETAEPLGALARHLRLRLRSEVLRCYEKRKQGQSATEEDQALLQGLSLDGAGEWSLTGDPMRTVHAALQMARELGFLVANQAKAPQLFREVKYRTARSLAAAYTALAPQLEQSSPALLQQLEAAWPTELPGKEVLFEQVGKERSLWRQSWQGKVHLGPEDLPEAPLEEQELLAALALRFEAAASREQQARILDWVCAWPTPAAVPVLGRIAREAWSQWRAMLNLTLRFGHPDAHTWEDWQPWLASQARLWQDEQSAWEQLVQEQPQGLLLLLYSQQPDPQPAALDALVQRVYESGPPLAAWDVIQSWSKSISLEEQKALLGQPAPAVAVPPPIPKNQPISVGHSRLELPPLSPVQVASVPDVSRPAQVPVSSVSEPATPPKPSLWETQIQPFFVEN